MIQFPGTSQEAYAKIYLDETDKLLPQKLDQNLRYAFFKTVAKGGKALIRVCRDLHLNRLVCYKTLLPEFANDEIEQQRFLREARVTAMLQHPNTVPVYELGRDNKGNCYFTMKFVHGYTLQEVLSYRDRYDLTQLLDIIIQVAHALEYAHSHGVIHRDVKPANILIGPYGEILLLDWGLAKVWSVDGAKKDLLDFDEQVTNSMNKSLSSKDLSITGMGKLQGSLAYMSIEQVSKDPNIDSRTDVYSLGAVLYEVLTGRTPAQGDTVNEMLSSVKEHIPEKPSSLSHFSISSNLDSICLACLDKDVDKRLQSVSELLRLIHDEAYQLKV